MSNPLPNVEIDLRALDLWCLEYLFHVGTISSDHVVERIEELFRSKRRDKGNDDGGTLSTQSPDGHAALKDARNWSYKLGVIKSIVSWVMDGNIERALETIRRDAPDILKNQKLSFLLHKQQFTELVRTANRDPSSIQKAIAYLQTHLAQNDLASSTYPKEYAQLKSAMLMLLFQPRPGSKPLGVADRASPIEEWLAKEWSLESRERLAGMLRKGLLRYFGIGEPKLSLLLRYLTLSHNMYYILYANGDQSPVQQYSDFFLLSYDGVDNDELDLDFPEEKGKAVVEGSIDSGSSISERDISVLAQSAGISPQKARGALARAASQLQQVYSQISVDEPDPAVAESQAFTMLWKQDSRKLSGLEIAMKTEVSRMRTGHRQLIDLVKSYCHRRGLVSPNEVISVDNTSLNLLDVKRSQYITDCRKMMQATIDDLISALPSDTTNAGIPIRPAGGSGTVTERLIELVYRLLAHELFPPHPPTNPIDELSTPLSKISFSNGRKRYDLTEFAVSSSSNGSTSQPPLTLTDAPLMQPVEPTPTTVEIKKRDDGGHDTSDGEEVPSREGKEINSKRSVVMAETGPEAANGPPRKSWREPRSDDRGADEEYLDGTLASACAKGWSESVVLAMMRARVIECCLCAASAECEEEIRTGNQGEDELIKKAENKDGLSMSGMVGSAHGWAGVYWELALMNLRDLTNAASEAGLNRDMYADAIREASSLVALRYQTAFMVSSINTEGPETAKSRKTMLLQHFRLLHGLLTNLVEGPICNMISARHFSEQPDESITPSLSSPTIERPASGSVPVDLTDDEGRQRGRALQDADRAVAAAERSPRGRPRRRRGGGSTSVGSKKATPPTITDMNGGAVDEDSQDDGDEVEDNALVWVVKSMLGIHERLFQLTWENDPFESVFCIDELRNTNDLDMFVSGEPLLTFLRKSSANASERKAASSAAGSSSAQQGRSTIVSTSESTWGSRRRRTESNQAPVENSRNGTADHDSDDDESQSDLDEGSISLLMEMMAFTRAEAIRTLMDHGGDVMSVISALIT